MVSKVHDKFWQDSFGEKQEEGGGGEKILRLKTDQTSQSREILIFFLFF